MHSHNEPVLTVTIRKCTDCKHVSHTGMFGKSPKYYCGKAWTKENPAHLESEVIEGFLYLRQGIPGWCPLLKEESHD